VTWAFCCWAVIQCFLFNLSEKNEMKKNLIALAVLAASGASMAQVTLYGVADLSLFAVNATGVRSDAQMGGNGTLNDGNSRWGIRGTEDLGGGMKASFMFEQNINYETGATGVASSRAAWMSLSGGFGTLKAGRTLSPSFYGMATWELTGAANFSAVTSQFVAVVPTGGRNDTEFSYTTPNWGGVSATLGYVTELDLTPAGNASKVDANVIYRAGPLAASLIYNKLSNVSDANSSVGVNYNFGSFVVAASYMDGVGQSQGWTLGASVPVGPWKITVDVAQDTGFDDTDYLLYAGYSLSKRTTVYGAYLNNGKSGTTVKKTANASETYGVGVRHNF